MTVEERLGKELFAKRRREENDRIAEFCQYLSPKFTYIKIHLIRPCQVFALKICGLYQKGRRDFHAIKVEENIIRIKNLPASLEGYTIMHMSDLHIDIDEKLADSILEAISGLNYDLCVMTGDYKNLTVGDFDNAIRLMSYLPMKIASPIYAVLGNHDTLDMVEPLEKIGYNVLLNESTIIEHGTGRLLLSGVDDPYIYATDSIENALVNLRPRQTSSGEHPATTATTVDARILLSHSATIYDKAARAGFNAMLCGHTHGGQVCLPNGYPILNNDRSPRKFLRGSWKYNDMQGYTSRGTGGCGLPIRLFCPPEITLHRLTRAAEA